MVVEEDLEIENVESSGDKHSSRSQSIFYKHFSRIWIVLLIVLGLVFLGMVGYLYQPNLVKSFGVGFLNNLVVERSKAVVFLEDEVVKVEFKIREEDRAGFESFSKNLGVGSGWMNGLELGLNSEATARVGNILPVELNILASEDSLEFGNDDLPGLNSSLSRQEYQSATLSGKLDVAGSGERDFEIEIVEPKDIYKEASLSGQIYFAKQFDKIDTILERVNSIYIKVSGQSIKGNVKLKNS